MDFKENNKAIYLQIADKVCDDVMLGNIAPGARISSVREQAATLQVNANTVMRSYEYLEREGIIFNRRGIGFFIADNAPEIIGGMRRESFFNDEIGQFFHRLMTLGVSAEELSGLYTNYLNTHRK